jgi:hypothetical protein
VATQSLREEPDQHKSKLGRQSGKFEGFQLRRPCRLFTGLLCWSACGPDGFVLWLESMRAGPHWLIGVPKWELMDLRITKSIRLFFTFILQGLKVRQKSKEGAYAVALACFANAAEIVSSVSPRKLFYLRRVEMAHRDTVHSCASIFI